MGTCGPRTMKRFSLTLILVTGTSAVLAYSPSYQSDISSVKRKCIAPLRSGRSATFTAESEVISCFDRVKRTRTNLGTMMSERTGPAAEWNKYVKAGLTQPLSPKRQPEGPLAEDPSLPMIEDIIRAADDRKAQSIWAVRVAHLTYSTEFFINVQGSSRPMLQVGDAVIFPVFRWK